MNSSEVSKSDKGRRGGSRDEIGTDEGNQKLAGKKSCTKCTVLGFVMSGVRRNRDTYIGTYATGSSRR